jgi:putative aldouronate transport system substrate-binding protein
MKKALILPVLLILAAGALVFAGGRQGGASRAERPLAFSMYYVDNSTFPFKNDWLTVTESAKRYNLNIDWQAIPMGEEWNTKVSLALNSGNAPDVILYSSTGTAERVSQAQNGAIYPISDRLDWTPNWAAYVREFNAQAEVDMLCNIDGKRYYLPALTDKPFYDGGLLLREDVLAKYSLPVPKTFDDLYNYLKAYKRDNPASYPLTVYYGPRVHYRMSQPSYGISVHINGAGGSRLLSWDYGRKTYFTGAISPQYREYMRYMAKLYAEGLLDPELAEPINGDSWTRKLATGAAIATYAYYDQIGGIAQASAIPGFKMTMVPPLAGPAGAHHQPNNRVGAGPLFPMGTSKRADFEQVVRAVDAMFFSKEAAELWCLGVEGVTFTRQNGAVKFVDSIASHPDGIYKAMQINYGCGGAGSQNIWINAQEMTKYDPYYGQLNQQVGAMDNAIQPIPPILDVPQKDIAVAERAAALQAALFDTFLVWDNDFLTGKKSLDADWNAYTQEMISKGINEFLEIYNKYHK